MEIAALKKVRAGYAAAMAASRKASEATGVRDLESLEALRTHRPSLTAVE